jgi:hypothetical protein
VRSSAVLIETQRTHVHAIPLANALIRKCPGCQMPFIKENGVSLHPTMLQAILLTS